MEDGKFNGIEMYNPLYSTRKRGRGQEEIGWMQSAKDGLESPHSESRCRAADDRRQKGTRNIVEGISS